MMKTFNYFSIFFFCLFLCSVSPMVSYAADPITAVSEYFNEADVDIDDINNLLNDPIKEHVTFEKNEINEGKSFTEIIKESVYEVWCLIIMMIRRSGVWVVIMAVLLPLYFYEKNKNNKKNEQKNDSDIDNV